MEALIRAKYEQKKYIDKDWLPPRLSVSHLSWLFAVWLIIFYDVALSLSYTQCTLVWSMT